MAASRRKVDVAGGRERSGATALIVASSQSGVNTSWIASAWDSVARWWARPSAKPVMVVVGGGILLWGAVYVWRVAFYEVGGAVFAVS